MPADAVNADRTGAGTIEVLRSDYPRGDLRAALFDFDGTLSLLRRNWQEVMIPMMVDVLAETGTGESRAQLASRVEAFVARLTGRQTIYQMIQLAEEVRRRGGQPLDPLAYKRRYHALLWRQVEPRIAAVRSGKVPADEMIVPGARALLEVLCAEGLTLYLSSGTDLSYVRDELAVLRLDRFFGPRVSGALDDYKKFSKAMLIQRILAETRIDGSQLVGFGDGFVEVQEIKKVGGLAIGVASNEETRRGINPWKRDRLISAGADIMIGDYRQGRRLLALIGVR